ncbi:MAG: alkaline phosphatase D family protein [Gemmatimonadales bacterium]
MDRREILAAAAYGMIAAGRPQSFRTWKRPRFALNPFTLGVASGDPTADGVVLWTRLANDPLNGGGMPSENVEVGWRIATDEGMANVVRKGTAVATPGLGHSVHVELSGLEPERWYWYQFDVGGEESVVGRTRTAPRFAASVDKLRFAFASCQHYEYGYYTAYRHMAGEDLDLVVHLGDYIYEYEGRDDRPRKHTGQEIESLWDYRNRYALYKTDPDLQAAHAAFPWIVTPDDHEVDNNYADSISQDNAPVEAFLRRRADAYRAYFEHMPLRHRSFPQGPDMRLYRRMSYGALAEFFVMDTRQYRTDQPCGDKSGPLCAAALNPNATLMGRAQEAWLNRSLALSASRWNILAQQVMMAKVDRMAGEEEVYSMDKWSGYEEARNRLMRYLAESGTSNPVVLTGDIHTNWVNDLKLDFRNEASPTVATEFVGTSISSGGDGRDGAERAEGIRGENPFVKFFNAQRGYVRCEITPDSWNSDYRVMQYVSRPGGPISTRASFVVENGRAGAEQIG